MTKKSFVTVTNGNAWPENNQVECLFKLFVRKEYQFEVTDGIHRVAVVFHKGMWTLKCDEDTPISVDDSVRAFCEDNMTEQLLNVLIEQDQGKTPELEDGYPERVVPANILWKAATMSVGRAFVERPSVIFAIHKPTRNGCFTDDFQIVA